VLCGVLLVQESVLCHNVLRRLRHVPHPSRCASSRLIVLLPSSHSPHLHGQFGCQATRRSSHEDGLRVRSPQSRCLWPARRSHGYPLRDEEAYRPPFRAWRGVTGVLSRGAVATAAPAADITEAGEWQAAPLTPPTRPRVPPRYVALWEATARGAVTAKTGGGVCGRYQCGRASRIGYVQGP